MTDDKILDISETVKWIGILDYGLITFDIIMETKYGSTYNSYFIDAERKTIIDTAKEKFSDTYLGKVKKAVNPAEIEYIVCNHTEPDHSGCVAHLLKYAPHAKIVGSGNALRYLKDITGCGFDSIQVKDGDTLNLGNRTLRFIGAPNLHWPDSMYTYLEEEKILFTCDSFGAHFCHSEMFDDIVPEWDDAFKYYFDMILKPYSRFMINAINKISGLEISVVCPGHGPVLRTYWKKYVELSAEYAREQLVKIDNIQNNVLIAYVSAYGYTAEMAKIIAEGISSTGSFNIEMSDIEKASLPELDEMLNRNYGIIVGSPTLNQNILLQVYKLFSVVNPVRDKGKPALAFGSYGWSGEGVKIIESALKQLKLDITADGIAVKFYPHRGFRETLFNKGREFALILKEKMKIAE